MTEFPTCQVDRSRSQSVEPLGSKPKFWFSDGDRRLLFKAEDRGTGEDWAEVVSCHLCDLLGLPHVEYELAAEYDGVRNLRDEEREERMTSKNRNRTVAAFAAKGRSAIYGSSAGLRALELREAFRSFRSQVPNAGRAWLDRLRSVNRDEIWRILERVPLSRMSEICKRFTLELLLTNQRRLLE